MIYECLIDKRHKKFIVAKSRLVAQLQEPWSQAEQEWPFEIGISEDVDLGSFDRSVRVQWSGGVMEVMASQISQSITDEKRHRQELFVREMNRRQYPINLRTLYQPLEVTGKALGDLR